MKNTLNTIGNLFIICGKKLSIGLLLVTFILSCSESQTGDTIYETTNEIVSEQDVTADNVKEASAMNPRSFGGEKDENQIFIDEIKEESDENIGDYYFGSYVGAFGKNMINITLYKMKDGVAEGYSVCAGNFRKIVGTYKRAADGVIDFKLDEPGDDKYDGSFEFAVNDETMVGKWTPFKTEGNSAKNYSLNKKVYTYDVNNGDYPEASTRLLTDEDVNNLDSDELAYMRNCIYARRGYSFKDKEWRYTFEQKDWYMPTCIDVRDKLTDIEVTNIELIYDYEAYYEMNYDDFGR